MLGLAIGDRAVRAVQDVNQDFLNAHEEDQRDFAILIDVTATNVDALSRIENKLDHMRAYGSGSRASPRSGELTIADIDAKVDPFNDSSRTNS